MPINVQCPGCGSRFRADEKLAGRRGKCPKCSALIEVKSDQQPPAQHRAPEETPTQPTPAEPKKATRLTSEKVPKTGSHRRCLDCGKKRKIFAYNYAGFEAKGVGQMEPLVLPGVKQRDFLCVDCANKRKLVCKKHGEVQGRIEYRAVPACQECNKEAEVRRTALEWGYWGEAQMLPCPFCGKKTERERVQMVFGGGGGGDIMSAFMGMAGAYDTSKGGKHIEQKCENCGRTFESRLAPDADALQHGCSFHQWRPGPAYAANQQGSYVSHSTQSHGPARPSDEVPSRYNSSKPFDELINETQGRNQWVRAQAARALGQNADRAQESVPVLRSLVKDANSNVRSGAVASLNKLGAAAHEALPELKAATRDSVGTIARLAREAIAKIEKSR